MADEPNVNTDDLAAFEAEFFNPKPVAKAEPVKETADTEETEAEEPVEANETDETDTTDDRVDDLDEDEPDSDEDEPEPPKKNRKTAKERIKELTAAAREAERREAEALRRLDAIQNNTPTKEDTPVKAEAKAPDPEAVKEDGSPVYPMGELDVQYIRDVAKFVTKQEIDAARSVREREDREAAVQKARAEKQAEWNTRLDETAKDVPDIRDKIATLGSSFESLDPNYGQYLVDVVMTLDNGPKVLAYLADNPAEADKIVKAGAASATVALGRLDATLTKPKTNKVSTKAPEPPSKVTRGTGGTFQVAPDTDDLDAFERAFYQGKKR